MSHCLRVSPFLAPPPLLICRPRLRPRGGRHRHAPRPILTLARSDPPPLLRLKVSDSSDCPPSSAAHPNHRPPLRLPRPRALIGSLASVWREGLFLVRCSVFAAVLAVAAALSWYAQLRARAFVEARLLPAACSLLSDHLQREVRVGRVRSVSPLGITLHTCSVGPHSHEFSCAEVPVLKIRVRPFASLSRGRLVVDALLSDPTALVAQTKDFSWLGIPAPSSEAGTPKRNSEEEGIDYRTKTRRLAREVAGEHGSVQRDRAAREAAERGYIVPSGRSISRLANQMLPEDDDDGPVVGTGKSTSPPLFADEMHRKDRHMDPGIIDSSSKHADLEKSFCVKSRIPGLNFWSRMIPNPTKRRYNRRKGHSKVVSDIDNSSQERILRRSAQAAVAYFQNIDSGNLDDNSSPGPGNNSSDGGHMDAGSGKATSNDVSSDTVPKMPPKSSYFLDYPGTGKSASAMPIINTADVHKAFDNKMLVCNRLEDLQHGKGNLYQGHVSEESESFSEDNIGPQQEFVFGNFGSCTYAYNWASFWPFQLKGSRISFNAPYASLGVELQKLKSRFAIGLEDTPAELIEGVGQIHPAGAQNTLPITLDSVYFSGGNLMLLGYGDQEPKFDLTICHLCCQHMLFCPF